MFIPTIVYVVACVCASDNNNPTTTTNNKNLFSQQQCFIESIDMTRFIYKLRIDHCCVFVCVDVYVLYKHWRWHSDFGFAP